MLVLLSIGTLDLAPPNSPPPPDFIGAAASRIYHGAPARQPHLTAAAEKVTAARLRGLRVLMMMMMMMMMHGHARRRTSMHCDV